MKDEKRVCKTQSERKVEEEKETNGQEPRFASAIDGVKHKYAARCQYASYLGQCPR